MSDEKTEPSLLPVDPKNPDDLGLCGLAPFETTINDPSYETCKSHDAEYNRNIEGLPNDGILDTTADFVEGEAEVEAKSLYGVVTAPIYSALVTVIGIPLWIWESFMRPEPLVLPQPSVALQEPTPQLQEPQTQPQKVQASDEKQ